MFHLVLFGWLINVEALGATSEKKVNLRLHGGEDVDEEKDRERNQK